MLESVTECYRVLQSITENSRVLQNIKEYYRVFLAHLLGPISGLVLMMMVINRVMFLMILVIVIWLMRCLNSLQINNKKHDKCMSTPLKCLEDVFVCI